MPSLLSSLVAALYFLCFAFLLALAGLVLAAPGTGEKTPRTPWSPVLHAPPARSSVPARHLFLLLALSLLLWQITLFWETRTVLPSTQLWLGRLNFAAVALAVFLAWRFVREVASPGYPCRAARWHYGLLWGETALVTLVTLGTPGVDETEAVVDGHAITGFGPLFPLYLLHVLGYLAAALVAAFRARGRTRVPARRGQLTVIGGGTLVTGSVSLITNALLPFAYDDFRFCDLGPLSVFFFLLAVAYAVFVHGLFAVRVVLRAALVYGLLLALVLGAYSSAVFVTTQYLTGAAGADKLTQFVVLFLAFSFDPLRRFLEEKTDTLLFGASPPRRHSVKRFTRRFLP